MILKSLLEGGDHSFGQLRARDYLLGAFGHSVDIATCGQRVDLSLQGQADGFGRDDEIPALKTVWIVTWREQVDPDPHGDDGQHYQRQSDLG